MLSIETEPPEHTSNNNTICQNNSDSVASFHASLRKVTSVKFLKKYCQLVLRSLDFSFSSIVWVLDPPMSDTRITLTFALMALYAKPKWG